MSDDEQSENYLTLRSLRRFLFWCLILVSVVAIWIFGCWMFQKSKRAHWKDGALRRLTVTSVTNEVVQSELQALRASDPANLSGLGWIHDHVLLLTNGEFIVFEYRHGANIYFPPHLFLGYGSNGRWLYSSFHFCNGLAAVRGENPPASISDFAQRYTVREFDGKSDECLKLTE